MDDFKCEVCRCGVAEPHGEAESRRWLCVEHHPDELYAYRCVEWNAEQTVHLYARLASVDAEVSA